MKPARLVMIASLAVLPACATLTHKSAHHLSVITDVSADCVFSDKLGPRHFHAPGVVMAEPSDAPATITCTRKGYKPASTAVDTHMNGMVLGNLLFGGLIGLAIDAGSGNASSYPEQVYLFLEPEKFASEADRLEWLARKRANEQQIREKNVQTAKSGYSPVGSRAR